MRTVTRIGAAVSASLLTAGVVSISGATAAQASDCGYPPSDCGTSFQHGKYSPGERVGFRSDKAFKRHETVDGVLSCSHGFRRLRGPFKANRHHRVVSSFHLPRKTPHGTCTFTLVGETSGHTASGDFRVKRH